MEEPSRSKAVIEMLTVANEYCRFIENFDSYDRDRSIGFLNSILSLMYLKGGLLPPVDVLNPDSAVRFVTEEQWQDVFNSLRFLFAKADEFYAVDAMEHSAYDATRFSMAELLADIYQDMKDFILLYQKNTLDAHQSAAREIRELFALNWGWKAIILTQYLHFLNYDSLRKKTELF